MVKIDDLMRVEIEKKASAFRSENGFNETVPIHLTGLLIKKNVITLFKPLSGLFAGMAVKADNDLRFMMINQTHNIGKQHFTIGHELYHLFIQENFTSRRCVTGLFNKQSDIEETKADLFSACLILPESGIKQLVPAKELTKKNLITTTTLFKIQHYYSVSFKSVIYRLWDLGFIDKHYFDAFSGIVKSTAKKLGYNMSLYEPGNFDKVFGDYGAVANSLFEQKKVSESHFFGLLNAINVDPLAVQESDDE
jgi:Zn-dependent peptidase ImmA (M78 family)